MSASGEFKLYYWPTILGRGEFVRLALEAGAQAYTDVARSPSSEGGGVAALISMLQDGGDHVVPFAPPILTFNGSTLSQTSAILHAIAPGLGLVASDDSARTTALACQLTLADLVSEVHDTHHPISPMQHYEDQADTALRRSQAFVNDRMPKYLRYFERCVDTNTDSNQRWILSAQMTYVDLSMFQVIAGLRHAFPNALDRLSHEVPKLMALAERVSEQDRVGAYLASERRIAFNQNGIFRHYPELDP